MKRTLFALIAILIAFSLLISCEEKAPEPATGDTGREVVVLDFEEINDRAMTDLPADNPFMTVKYGDIKSFNNQPYGLWVTCNAMRSLPILPGIKTTGAKEFLKSSKKFKSYGFPMIIERAEETEDGIYIVYSILEDNRKVGRIEYYYSSETGKFSYREEVIPFLGKYKGDYLMLVFELLDVPVKKDGYGLSFQAGDLYDNGSAFNYYGIIFGLGNVDPDSNGVDNGSLDDFRIEKLNMHMNYSKKDIDSASLGESTTKSPILLSSLGEENSRFHSIKINPKKVKNDYNLDFMIDFLSILFDSSSFALDNAYKTIDDFNANKLKETELMQSLCNKANNIEYCHLGYPTSRNLSKNSAAAFVSKLGSITVSTYDNKEENNREEVRNAFKDRGYTVNTYDDFVISLFTKLGFDEALIDKRMEILKDCYNQ